MFQQMLCGKWNKPPLFTTVQSVFSIYIQFNFGLNTSRNSLTKIFVLVSEIYQFNMKERELNCAVKKKKEKKKKDFLMPDNGVVLVV